MGLVPGGAGRYKKLAYRTFLSKFAAQKSETIVRNLIMSTIFLLGYMGCGKTTLGRALAEVAEMDFLDLDEYIEEKYGTTITDLFARMGERRYRQLEREALIEVAHRPGTIVSTGGGTPCHFDNIDIMNRSGLTIWLQTSPERLALRLCLPGQRHNRPLIANLSDDEVLQTVKVALDYREQFYGKAQLRFDSTDIETAEQTRATAATLHALLKQAGVL